MCPSEHRKACFYEVVEVRTGQRNGSKLLSKKPTFFSTRPGCHVEFLANWNWKFAFLSKDDENQDNRVLDDMSRGRFKDA